MGKKKETTKLKSIDLTDRERTNPLFWQDGIIGEFNIFSCSGDECRGIGFIADDAARKEIIDEHNLGVRVLMDNLVRLQLSTVQQQLATAALQASTPAAALKLATLFHDTYERLAPQFGYETRQDTKQFDPNSPNGQLMQAVAKEILKDYLPLGNS